ncbi:MAG: hypothetical protein RL745_779, partial [Actinomycetota bacterium]
MTDTNTREFSAMLLPELKKLAAAKGIPGATTMKKADLIAALSSAGGSSRPSAKASADLKTPAAGDSAAAPQQSADGQAQASGRDGERGQDRGQDRAQDRAQERGQRDGGQDRGQRDGDRFRDDRRNRNRDRGRGRDRDHGRDRDRGDRNRNRDRDDYEVSDDDTLATCGGILDILENYAFVRTRGYLPSPDDAYVSLSMVKRFGLRKGDVVTGSVRLPRDGEGRQKFNPLVRIETVNGDTPDNARSRVEFSKLTPLYPQERLRLETEPTNMVTRVIDLVAPIGKGQRGLIVSPPKAGKTMVLQA